MFFKFLSHQWTSFWRGRNKAGSLIAKIILMLLYLYFFLVALGIGLFMKDVIRQLSPGAAPVLVFNGIILYYFMADFLARIQLQELPTISIQPYLAMNIRKKAIINFLNSKTLFSFFNVVPLFIFLPFVFTEIAPHSGNMAAFGYAVSIISFTLFNNFFALWLKRHASNKGWFLVAGVLTVLLLAGLDYFHIISIRSLSNSIFGTVADYPYLSIIFIVLGVAAFLMHSKFLSNNLYVEELVAREELKVSTDYPFLNRFGKTGQLAATELKLILRHKRSRGSLMMSFIFVLYGFFFYKKELLDNNQFSMMLFAAIFMTGIFQIAYGQFMYAWQSNHFDGLMANRIDHSEFIKSKFLLFTLAASLVTMITMFYGFISWKLILLHISVYLYNIGFGSVIVLFFANYNKKRLDLSKGATFNWQGVGATQWLLGLPLILLPFLIYMPFGMNDKPFWGLISIGIFGLITLAMQPLWIKWLTHQFNNQRYKLAEGFRE